MKNIKDNKQWLAYVILLIPFIKPPFFEYIDILDKAYQILFIINSFIILLMCWNKKCISKLSIFSLVYILVLLISSICNNTLTISTMKTMIEIFILSLMINYGCKYRCHEFLKALIFITSILIWINFITILMFPNGMYTNDISKMTDNFFLGMDNIHVTFFMVFWLSSYTYYYVYNKKGILIFLTHVTVILSIILRWSATTVVGFGLIAFYFLFSKYLDKLKVINVTSYAICYVIAFLSIIFFRVQKLFSFIIVSILKKDITFTNRLRIWDFTIKMIGEKPLFGYGASDWKVRTLKFGFSHAHNIFLEVTYQGGIILFIIFIFLIVSVLRKIRKYFDDKLAKVFMIFIFAFFAMMLMESYAITYIFLVLSFCYSIDYFLEIKKLH